jgi:site-specific recombinase XerD
MAWPYNEYLKTKHIPLHGLLGQQTCNSVVKTDAIGWSLASNSTVEQAIPQLLNRARFRSEHCPASPWVFAHKDGSRIEAVHHGFSSLCKRVGIEDFRIHDLRHTCASWLVSAGIPLREVQELLGHGSIQMTERYAHLSPENLKSAMTVLERITAQSPHSGENRALRNVG